MNQQMYNQVLTIILTRWSQGECSIASETIYEYLCNAGESVSDGELNEIFEDLRDEGLINGALSEL